MKSTIKILLTKFLLKIIVYLNKDSKPIYHCKNEVSEWFKEKDSPNKWVADSTVELLAVLSSQGHSGSSIQFVLEFFKAMALFKPWGPLTGEEHEWAEPFCEEGTQQNKRCFTIFRRKDGTAYNTEGKIFHDGDEVYYKNSNSFVDITFPYVLQDPIIVDTTKKE